jgi:hypothetical protein
MDREAERGRRNIANELASTNSHPSTC